MSAKKRKNSTPQEVADEVLDALKDLVASGTGYINQMTVPKDIETALLPISALIAGIIEAVDTKSKKVNKTKLLEGVADSCAQRVRRGEGLQSVVSRIFFALMERWGWSL